MNLPISSLRKGGTLQTVSGKRLTILTKLAEGGQAEIYPVNFEGTTKVLKWFFDGPAEPERWGRLGRLIASGSPGPTFVWPEELVPAQGSWKTFGHVRVAPVPAQDRERGLSQ